LTAHVARDRVKELNLEPELRVYIKSKETKAFPLHYSI
jgi:sulfate/thiosulfate transport system ATP-binding protein